jgi:hypothetical protein
VSYLDADSWCALLSNMLAGQHMKSLAMRASVNIYGSERHSNARLRLAGVRLRLGLCLRADAGGHHKQGDQQAEQRRGQPGSHGSSMKQGKVSMVKTRLAQWVSRWRERRLAREQKRQTSAARQAVRDTEAQRYHSTGHGP